jgi:hypothetical protein
MVDEIDEISKRAVTVPTVYYSAIRAVTARGSEVLESHDRVTVHVAVGV